MAVDQYYRTLMGHPATPILDLAGGYPIPGGVHMHGWVWVHECVMGMQQVWVHGVHQSSRVETSGNNTSTVHHQYIISHDCHCSSICMYIMSR